MLRQPRVPFLQRARQLRPVLNQAVSSRRSRSTRLQWHSQSRRRSNSHSQYHSPLNSSLLNRQVQCDAIYLLCLVNSLFWWSEFWPWDGICSRVRKRKISLSPMKISKWKWRKWKCYAFIFRRECRPLHTRQESQSICPHFYTNLQPSHRSIHSLNSHYYRWSSFTKSVHTVFTPRVWLKF